jgi:hypothetical protein
MERGRDQGRVSEKGRAVRSNCCDQYETWFSYGAESVRRYAIYSAHSYFRVRGLNISFFISKLKTFDKALLAAQKLYESHDYTIWSAP